MLYARLIFYFISIFGLVSLSTCSDNTPVEPSDPEVMGATNLRAYSAPIAVGLQWSSSHSEGQDNFGGYRITVINKNDYSQRSVLAPKGSNGYIISNLTNGTRYQFIVHGVTIKGKASADSTSVEWAPAPWNTTDAQGQQIRIYATTSALPSGIDLFTDHGKSEILELTSPEFATRGDFFLYAQNSMSTTLELRSPDLSITNPGLKTEFSNAPSFEADSFTEQYSTAPPSSATFMLSSITLTDKVVTKGRIFYGRLLRGSDKYYFRILVKKGMFEKYIQGAGSDRYIEIEVSFQSTPNVPFAKR